MEDAEREQIIANMQTRQRGQRGAMQSQQDEILIQIGALRARNDVTRDEVLTFATTQVMGMPRGGRRGAEGQREARPRAEGQREARPRGRRPSETAPKPAE